MSWFEWWYSHSSTTTGRQDIRQNVKWRSIESDNANLMAFDGISPINSASSGCKRMGIPPFDSPQRAGSNGGIPILLRPLDAEIFDETSNGAVPKVIKTPI